VHRMSIPHRVCCGRVYSVRMLAAAGQLAASQGVAAAASRRSG
jgi:hypothetical protein